MERSGGSSSSGKEKTRAAGQLSCIPHVNTLTNSGKPNFSDPVDAICELVDNGMQASMDIEGLSRRVDVYVFQPEPGTIGKSGQEADPTLLVIRDNGQGMDQNTLAAYFTYFEGQKDRGLAPEGVLGGAGAVHHLTSTISKFGVGATQAGFYLADTITVVSKWMGDGLVRWACVSEEELQKNSKALGKEKAADAYMIPFYQGKTATEALPKKWLDCKPLVDMCGEVSRERHFSLIVLTLRPVHYRALGLTGRGDCRRLATSLANPYYYYLHPEEFPQLKEGKREELGELRALGKAPLKRGVVGGGSGRSTPVSGGDRERGRSSGASTPVSPHRSEAQALQLHMDLRYFKSWNLSFLQRGPPSFSYTLGSPDLWCLESDYLRASPPLPPFTFTLEVPLAKNAGDSVPLPSDAAAVVQIPTTTVYGILRYFGFRDYAETHPLARLAEQGNGTTTGTSPEQRVLDVRWMGRLLPEAVVNRLFFFPPPSSSKLARNDASLAARLGPWERRVHGCLFLNQWDVSVSYNKLKLLQGDAESLEAVMCDGKRTSTASHDRKLADRFTEWLAKCHELDKEHQLEGDKRFGGTDKTFWERVRFGVGKDDVFRRGDKIQLFKPNTQGGRQDKAGGRATGGAKRRGGAQASGSGGGVAQDVYAEIVDFFVRKHIDEATYSGDDVFIYYRRLPEEAFGSARLELPLLALDPSRSRVAGSDWERAMREQKRLKPHKISILECSAGCSSAEPVLKEPSDNYEPLDPNVKHYWQAGAWLPQLGIKLLDDFGHNIHDTNANVHNYRVRERVTGPLGFQTKEYMADLKKECSGAYYLHLGSDSCKLDLVGTYNLTLTVLLEDNSKPKLPREVVLSLVTQAGTPEYFDAPELPNSSVVWASLKLSSGGSRLPPFHVFVRDHARVATSANIKVWWEVLFEEGEDPPPFHVAFRPGRNDALQPHYQGPIEADAGLFFSKKSPWLLCPGPSFGLPYSGAPLLSASAFATRALRLSLRAAYVDDEGEDTPLYLEGNGSSHEDRQVVKLVLEPGEPCLHTSIMQGLPNDKTLRLHDGDTIPQLKDWNGNSTCAPQGNTWQATLSSEWLAPPSKFQFKVDSKGDCPIQGLQVRMPSNSWREGDVSSKSGVVKLEFEAENLKGTLHTHITLAIKPATTPHALQLFHKATRLDTLPSPMEWPRFLPLRPLVLRVVTISGQPVASLPPDVNITTSWTEPTTVIPKVEDDGVSVGEGELRLDSPTLVLESTKTHTYQVTATHASFPSPLVCLFKLKPLPGPAAGWCITWASKERPQHSLIRMGNPLGPFTITQTDQEGMKIPRLSLNGLEEGHGGWPLITITQHSPMLPLAVDPPALSLTFDPTLQGWTTTHPYTFTGPEQTVRLTVQDVGGRRRTGDLRLVLKPGRAKEVRVSSESLGLALANGEEDDQPPLPTISQPAGTTVRDLRVYVCDGGGHNPAYLEANTALSLLYKPLPQSSSSSSSAPPQPPKRGRSSSSGPSSPPPASTSSDGYVVLSSVVFAGKKPGPKSPPPSTTTSSSIDREGASAVLPPFPLPPMPQGHNQPLSLYVRLTPPPTSSGVEVVLPALRYVAMLTNGVLRAEAMLCVPLPRPLTPTHDNDNDNANDNGTSPMDQQAHNTEHKEEGEGEEPQGDTHAPYRTTGQGGGSSTNAFAFRVDEAWPCVALRLVTHDQKPLRPRPSPEQLRLSLRHIVRSASNNGEENKDLLEEAFEGTWQWGTINGQREWIILTPKPLPNPHTSHDPLDPSRQPAAPPLQPGRFELHVSFLETRPHLLPQLPPSDTEGGGGTSTSTSTSRWQPLGPALRFKVYPGAVYRLVSASSVPKPSVTNRPQHPTLLLFPPRPRHDKGGLQLIAADVYGFPASLPEPPPPLTFTLRPNAHDAPTMMQLQQGKTIPALQHIQPVAPSRWGADGCWQWAVGDKVVALDSAVGGPSVIAQGELEIVGQVQGLVDWSSKVTFNTDHHRQEEIQQLEVELCNLKPHLESMDDHLTRATQQQRQAQAQINNTVHTAVMTNQHLCASFRTPAGASSVPPPEHRHALYHSLQQEQQRLAAPPRPLCLPRYFPPRELTEACQNGLGLGPDPSQWPSIHRLAYVTDPHYARVLSWAVGDGNMSSLLVNSKEEQRRVGDHVQSYCRALMRPYKPTRPGPLPLPTDVASRYPGFVAYAVNLLELDPEHEQAGLRCLLWWNLLSETMVFDTLQHAQDYREARILANDKKLPPTIVTLDGNRLTAKGAAGGRNNRLESNPPSYVFAARPAASSPAYQSLAQACATLERLQDNLTTFEHASQQLASLQHQNHSLVPDRQRLQHIQQRLIELGATPRGSSSGPTSPPARAPTLRGELAELQRTAQAWKYHDPIPPNGNGNGPPLPPTASRHHSISSTNSQGSSNGHAHGNGIGSLGGSGSSSRGGSGGHNYGGGRDSRGGGGGSSRDPRYAASSASGRGHERSNSNHSNHSDGYGDRRRPRDQSPRSNSSTNEPSKRHKR